MSEKHTPCNCSVDSFLRIQFCPLHQAAPELLAACKAQHLALDSLLAMIIAHDHSFFPTKSEVWPAVLQGNAAVEKAGGWQ